MPTLLEASNEVLIMVGEREVSSFNSPVGRKIRLAMRRAQSFVGVLHDWRHLRARTISSSWVGDTATLTPFHNVYSGIYRQTTTATYELMEINPDALEYKARNAPLTGIPQYFAIVGENQVQLYPSPTPAMQPLIEFEILLKPTISSNPQDVMQGPDMYNDLVTLYAQVIMHRSHTTDLNAAEATVREFETNVHIYRSRDVLQPVSFL